MLSTFAPALSRRGGPMMLSTFAPALSRRERTDDAVHVLPADAKQESRFASSFAIFRSNSMHSMRHVLLSVVVVFALVLALLAVSPLALAQVPLQFVAVHPCRVADTRWAPGPFGGPALPGQTSRDFTIPDSACSIPNTAVAYSLNVTVVPHGGLGYLTVWPAGQTRPAIVHVEFPRWPHQGERGHHSRRQRTRPSAFTPPKPPMSFWTSTAILCRRAVRRWRFSR